MKKYFYRGHYFRIKELKNGRFLASVLYGNYMLIRTTKKRAIKAIQRVLTGV